MTYKEVKKDELILRDYLAAERTHLANERTILAYLRTAIILLGTGLTIYKLFEGTLSTILVSAALAALGFVVGTFGMVRFLRTKRKLHQFRLGS